MELTHLDSQGRARMVDVGEKATTNREAQASGLVRMKKTTLTLIQQGSVAKGDVFTLAQVAGIMAAKRVPDLIPLCHPLALDDIRVDLAANEEDSTVEITATVRSTGKTGVEMEALTAVAVAALTVYDMCKSADRGMRIEGIRLVKKSGGKSGTIVFE